MGDHEPVGRPAPLADPDERLVPCRVAGIATIDNKGRVRLRSAVDAALRGLSMLVVDDMIQVRIDGPGGSELDERGRITMPQSLLDAVGLTPGGRVAILEIDELTLGLAAVDRLGLRRRESAA